MAEKVKRSKTKYTSIYFNESTKKYDVKYNFKEYDVKTGKNKYRAKWAYNLNTIAEAKKALAELQTGGAKASDKDITLEGAFELWKIRAQAKNFSPVTTNNTEEHLRMIYQFIFLKNISFFVPLLFGHAAISRFIHSIVLRQALPIEWICFII